MSNSTTPDEILREKDLRALDGLSPSAREREKRAGRYPPSFPLSPDPNCRSRGYSKREIQAWQSAIIRGATEADLKALVASLVAARSDLRVAA